MVGETEYTATPGRVRAGALPRLVLLADRFTEPAWAEAALQAVRAGVRWVHFRDHTAADADFARVSDALRARLRDVSPDVRVSVNTRIAVAQRFRLDLHVGTRGPSVRAAREALPRACVGFSAHSAAEARQAEADGAAYLFISPIFPTTSKPGHPGIGLSALRSVSDAVAAPVFALGGVTPSRVRACLEAGAYGVAVLAGILRAPDPAAAARAYLAALS